MADVYNTPDDALGDVDFQQSKPETQRQILRGLDKKGWGVANDAEIDAFINKMKPNWTRENQKLEAIGQERMAIPANPPPAKKTMWQKAVAPLTDAVGKGMEMATEPLVPLARMMQGEGIGAAYGPESFKTVGHGGRAAETRQAAGAGVVPQSPWQAGAMAAPFIPGVAGAGALARVGAAAGGAGALQGLFGEKGVAEGGSAGEAGLEALLGSLKGAATQGSGEMLGKMAGGTVRMPFTGRNNRIQNADAANVANVAREINPAFANAPRTSHELGVFAQGTNAVEDAAGAHMGRQLQDLEAVLTQHQGHNMIQSSALTAVYRDLVRSMGRQSQNLPQLRAMSPVNGGFTPQQAVDVLKLLTDRLKLNPDAGGHWNQEAINGLVASIERVVPPAARGQFTRLRADYAQAKGIEDLLRGAFNEKPGGYQFDMRGFQKALSEDPGLVDRIGQTALARLFRTASRGRASGPGFADTPHGNVSVPYPTMTGTEVAALRNMLTRTKRVGELPYTVPQGAKAGLGVAATGASSSNTRRQED